MKVLVYGAGVIGSYLAHVLCRAGHDVALLARGAWADAVARDGLTIRHSLQRRTSVDHPRMVRGVDGEGYDVVFAAMQHQQMTAILPDLARVRSPLVVLVGNNLSAPAMEAFILGHTAVPKTVLFGFQATGGRREGGRVVCIRWNGGGMTIGGLHSEPAEAHKALLQALVRGTGYRLTWMRDMDAWYKCHAAFILPVCYLCYGTGCNLRRATRAQRKQLLDAAIEGYRLLMALGCPILPEGDEAYCRPGIQQRMVAAMIFVMAKTVIGDLAASDHCRHAVKEMEGLDRCWAALRANQPGFPMPGWDALRAAMPDWGVLSQAYGGHG